MSSDETYPFPRRWSEMSFDRKFFFASFFVLMIMFVAGGALTIEAELTAAAILLAIGIGSSIFHKLKAGWRWRGAGLTQYGGAVASLLFSAVFLFATAEMAPITDTRMLPWRIGVVAIGLMNALVALRLVRPSQAQFDADISASQGAIAETPAPPTPIAEATERTELPTLFAML